jgi:hypothetical protein
MVFEHAEFEEVAARFRAALRRRDDAGLDEARADLDRLARENARAAARRAALAAKKAKKNEGVMATWNEAQSEAKSPGDSGGGPRVFLKLKEDGAAVEFAIVGEPHVYWRPKFENRSRKVKRFLLNVFVPGHGMRVFETSATTFEALAGVVEQLDIKTTMVYVKRSGKPHDPETTYAISSGGSITPEIAAHMGAAELHNLVEIAERSVAREEASPAPIPMPPRTAVQGEEPPPRGAA